MVLAPDEPITLCAELLSFARACSWIELDELSEIESLAPHMNDDECLEVLSSLKMEALLRGDAQGA